jgi:hypothetical protein
MHADNHAEQLEGGSSLPHAFISNSVEQESSAVLLNLTRRVHCCACTRHVYSVLCRLMIMP